jgi:hypothetical protein
VCKGASGDKTRLLLCRIPWFARRTSLDFVTQSRDHA